MKASISPIFAANIFNRLLTISSQILVGFYLTPGDIGDYAVAASTCALVSIFQSSDLSRISLQSATNLKQSVEAIKNWQFAGTCITFLLLVSMGQLFSPNVNRVYLLILGALPFARIIVNSRIVLLSAKAETAKIATAAVMEGITRSAVLVLLAYSGLGGASLLISEVVAVAASVSLFLYWTGINRITTLRIDPIQRNKLGLIGIASLLMQVDKEFSIYIVGNLCTRDAAGNFFFASRIAAQLAVVIGPMLTVETIPRLVQAFRTGSISNFKSIRRIEFRRLLSVCIPIAAALILVAPIVLILVWGEKWKEAALLLPILSMTAALRIGYGFCRAELEAMGAIGKILTLSAIDAALLVCSQSLGAFAWGPTGAALAMLFETLLIIGISRHFAKSRLSHE